MVRSMVHYTVHSAAALSAFRALPRLASPGHPHTHAHPPPLTPTPSPNAHQEARCSERPRATTSSPRPARCLLGCSTAAGRTRARVPPPHLRADLTAAACTAASSRGRSSSPVRSAPSLRPLCALSAPSLRPLCALPCITPCPARPSTHPPACPLCLLLSLGFPPPCAADPHVHRRLRAPPPLFNFQRERLQFLQEASATAEAELVVPTPTRFPCTSAACRLVLTAPPSREPIFFSRTGVGD